MVLNSNDTLRFWAQPTRGKPGTAPYGPRCSRGGTQNCLGQQEGAHSLHRAFAQPPWALPTRPRTLTRAVNNANRCLWLSKPNAVTHSQGRGEASWWGWEPAQARAEDLRAAASAWRGCKRAGEGLWQGHGVIGQGVMALGWKMGDLN